MMSLIVAAAAVLLFLLLFGAYVMAMPGTSHSGPLPPLTPEEDGVQRRLEDHVRFLAGDIGERNALSPGSLEKAGEYLREVWEELGYEVELQEFEAHAETFRNLAVELPGAGRPGEIVVVGAHYDSVEGSPGANDNASGVAALLELARLLQTPRAQRTIRFVAFVNEEPPYFLSDAMGSVVYARACRKAKEKVVAMLSLETIGFYSDAPKSQLYPPLFGNFYPPTGNFIAFVSNLRHRNLVGKTIGAFRERVAFPSEGVSAPAVVPGVSWSDQWAFWRQGYPALMVTDTALYRYPHYHAMTDTPDKLDYERTARVVAGLARVVEFLANPD